jgi:hypothetical protein
MILKNLKNFILACMILPAIFASALAEPFPLFQTAVIDVSGTPTIVGDSSLERDASENEVWGDGEMLRVPGKKGFFAKIAISDLAVISFDPGAEARLHTQTNGVVSPPEIELLKGSCFFKTGKGKKKPLVFKVGDLSIKIPAGAGYLLRKGDRVQAISGMGSLKVVSSDQTETVKSRYGYMGSVSKGLGSVKKLPSDKMKKLAKIFKKRFPDKGVPVLPDLVAPVVKIVSPRDGTSVDGASVDVSGVVDDPSVSSVLVRINGVNQGVKKVNGGRFAFQLKLFDQRNSISVSAEDENRKTGEDSISVISTNPATRPKVEEKKPKTFMDTVKEKLSTVKEAAVNPANPAVFIGVVVGAGILIFIGILVVKKIISASKSTVQKASELATGIVFERCEKCSDREYQYHLFYTTETVNSPFLRNLINNVNPMATSMMNESLESLLSTGLKWSQKAKQAENKLRVICRWCDTCKTGTLSLEHMERDEVVKVDDYQIIHPIFIEWVRKVYD